MKLVTVSALLCAMITLIVAAEGGTEAKPSEEHLVEKRWYWYKYRGWYKYGNRYYRYFPYRLDWVHAQRHCQSMHANLASVRNLREYRVIQRVIYRATHSYPITWLGGSDAQKEHHWFWIDGTPFSFTYWCRGEPNNARHSEHCMHMNSSRHKCMNDIYCHYRYPYVCVWKRR
ncbi:ladderlectin-like isoform X3 [Simochromis diagramma]|uniref:ladderlectin-like isoform X3 n=1 Tax=Simochromis diagramma TaxID=43689 RepID=UPI001A7EEC72|nr:ladderlectin-like isoform X3 [Simochromis diagramma]